MKKNLSLAFMTSLIGGPLLTLFVEAFLIHILLTDDTLELAAIAVSMMAIGVLAMLVFAIFVCLGVYRRREWGLIVSAVVFSVWVFIIGVLMAHTGNQLLDTAIWWLSVAFSTFLIFVHARELS